MCGATNLRVTNTNAVVIIPNFDPVTCANLQRAGDLGFIEAQFCPALPGFTTTQCGCAEIAGGGGIVATPAPTLPGVVVTPAPTLPVVIGLTPAPTPAPTMVQPVPPSPGFPVCNVCGADNLRVTLLDANVTIGGQDPVTCIQLQDAGDQGFIEAQFCPAVPAFAMAFCGCADVGDNTPVPTPAPTPLPTPLPTPVPTTDMGGGGTANPTCAVCGSAALRITVPSNIVSVPGLLPMTCMNLQLAGDLGFLDVATCTGIDLFVNNAGCGCAPI